MADASAIDPAEYGLLQLPHTVASHDTIEETVANGVTKEGPAVAADLLGIKLTIHRFPSNLLRFGRERDFIAPGTVAIGPYYHGMPELQPMEKVKHIAVDYFFKDLAAGSWGASYEKIKFIASDARSCYADEDALQGITDEKFAEIMFIDECFLLQFVDTVLRNCEEFFGIINPHGIGVMRDMLLLENQIPWLVMEVLMPFKSFEVEDIYVMVHEWLHGTTLDMQTQHLGFGINEHYKPSHLLCLVRSYEVASSENVVSSSSTLSMELPIYTSAAELGISLEASQKRRISAIDIAKAGFFRTKLMLAPLNLETVSRCWLVNIAAFEMWSEWDECIINSYLSFLSLLMNREDVCELRVKRIVLGCSSDRQTLEFFNDLAPYLPEGQAYWRIIGGLQEYRQNRWAWIAIYRFVYKNSKTIATVLSILGVLVGIFKTLLSLKQPPAH